MNSPRSHEAAPRQLPVAHQRIASGEQREKRAGEAKPESETRLQAAVGRHERRDDRDPYADVPCTD